MNDSFGQLLPLGMESGLNYLRITYQASGLALACLLWTAGAAWAISSPGETLRRAQAGKELVPQRVKTTGTQSVEVFPTPLTLKDIPPALARLRKLENVNSRWQDPDEFGGAID